MAAFRTAFMFVRFSFRSICVLTQIALLLVVAPIYLLVSCFLPADWTLSLWQSASDLYAHSELFKAATIASATLLCLPILGVWPGKPPEKTTTERLEEADMAIAARRQDESLAKLRNSMANSHGSPPSWWGM
ncbi:hypothetical protein N7E02_03860 (plasmid) [Aliirhizobium terrae]|uniref:hypothetical protein n=1 Tax=Terrirhizobium terrae TaxID=2926709 RepID=UPI0025753D16|nr:hypothetical protein [Rhizobium sp. CC-CFT758]WJH38552.1 hypothetical protein N7E02_03860 [Rhizobium sp. CC-CFT758]